MIVAAKITVVAICVAGLVTATVFTFGAAGVATAAITSTALYGTGAGLVSATLATFVHARVFKMMEYTGDDLLNTIKFIIITFFNTLAQVYLWSSIASSTVLATRAWFIIPAIAIEVACMIGFFKTYEFEDYLVSKLGRLRAQV